MKYLAALLLVAGLSVSVTVSAQGPLEGLKYPTSEPVSIQFHDVALGRVLHSVGSAAGLTILIDSGVDTTRNVNITLRRAPLKDVLTAVVSIANAKVTVVSPTTILLQPR